ncbi:hypothetical protein CFH90_17245 [Acinetobacter johnsonii]|uniref:Glycosyltransferase RgtA/B/C/D-like domain-containing protein n=1 Tax=Acinetobacter johnsonii TaxID=40214 RepID=A0A3Q8XG36_ACIJO|nr:hypothetical protein [Acinetobacter johnsonii]AZN65668.1 hypothetical protein CFH90_17245 [Acinetobacter johnsonii]
MLSSSAFQLISSFLVFIIGLFIVLGIRKYFWSNLKRASLLYIWHTILCVVYFWYVIYKGGDATMYFTQALLYGFEGDFSFGTGGIIYLTSFLVHVLGLSFFGCFLFFNAFGAIGLIAFDSTLRYATQESSRSIKLLAFLIIFLPSVSFWSSAVGKDSISFMAACLALWAALNFKKRIILFIFAVLAMLLVRPHVAAVMVAAYALAFIFDNRASIIQRLLVGSMAIIASVVVIPLAMQYAGLGDAQNAADIETYIEQRQGHNLEGGSSVDISSMSLPMQLFTYLFRPLPFEANSIFALAASVDNMILLLLFMLGIIAIFKKSKPLVESNRAFLWIYAVIVLFILATTTANLGIAMRQKWMFAPILIFLLISVIRPRKIRTKV